MATYTTVEHIRKALAKVGAPVDLVQCIRHTSNEKTQELMANCDYAVATGGAALVKVVYAAGVPAQTVGAGNVISIVDSTVDIPTVASSSRNRRLPTMRRPVPRKTPLPSRSASSTR